MLQDSEPEPEPDPPLFDLHGKMLHQPDAIVQIVAQSLVADGHAPQPSNRREMYAILFISVGPMGSMGGTVWNEDYSNAFLNCIDLFDPSLDKTLKFAAYRPDEIDREFKWGAWNICLVKQLVELLQVHPTLEVVSCIYICLVVARTATCIVAA